MVCCWIESLNEPGATINHNVTMPFTVDQSLDIDPLALIQFLILFIVLGDRLTESLGGRHCITKAWLTLLSPWVDHNSLPLTTNPYLERDKASWDQAGVKVASTDFHFQHYATQTLCDFTLVLAWSRLPWKCLPRIPQHVSRMATPNDKCMLG